MSLIKDFIHRVMDVPRPLHTLSDGSSLRIMSAKELIRIPIWKGNRIIDQTHVDTIKASIKGNVKALDFGYRIVSLMVDDAGGNQVRELFVIDGQHRHRVLYDYFHENVCVEDFPIVIIEKEVHQESDIISYFKKLNTQMAIPWKSDPSMIANQYIGAVEAIFKKDKKPLLRPGATKRPYLSVEKLREALLEVCKRGLLGEGADDVRSFVERVVAYNARALKDADMSILSAKKGDADIIQKAADLKFMLAVDLGLGWVSQCASSS